MFSADPTQGGTGWAHTGGVTRREFAEPLNDQAKPRVPLEVVYLLGSGGTRAHSRLTKMNRRERSAAKLPAICFELLLAFGGGVLCGHLHSVPGFQESPMGAPVNTARALIFRLGPPATCLDFHAQEIWPHLLAYRAGCSMRQSEAAASGGRF
ncbi:Hypothetical predicted protein [Podarcis lilfordi]|uniref:Uncharacterized protein n=1 Tax=Podarcis lilfordi TaxID=74358 RepID=A0AA35P7T9_9SAUR|nr:Hypothetical predicted protein [Podarcis lilfordi]